MGFGQAGLAFLGGLADIAQPFIPLAQQFLGGGRQLQQPASFFPQAPQQAGLGDFLQNLVDPQSPLGQVLPGFPGGAGAPSGLFRQTMSRLAPVNEFAVIGPDGKCHTWLHAVPRGWKINKSNVTGRRRHHHHHPR